MQWLGSDLLRARAEPWIGLALCVAVVLGWAWERLVPNPDGPQAFAPGSAPARRRGRRGGNHAAGWSIPASARAAGAALDRSRADLEADILPAELLPLGARPILVA